MTSKLLAFLLVAMYLPCVWLNAFSNIKFCLVKLRLQLQQFLLWTFHEASCRQRKELYSSVEYWAPARQTLSTSPKDNRFNWEKIYKLLLGLITFVRVAVNSQLFKKNKINFKSYFTNYLKKHFIFCSSTPIN